MSVLPCRAHCLFCPLYRRVLRPVSLPPPIVGGACSGRCPCRAPAGAQGPCAIRHGPIGPPPLGGSAVAGQGPAFFVGWRGVRCKGRGLPNQGPARCGGPAGPNDLGTLPCLCIARCLHSFFISDTEVGGYILGAVCPQTPDFWPPPRSRRYLLLPTFFGGAHYRPPNPQVSVFHRYRLDSIGMESQCARLPRIGCPHRVPTSGSTCRGPARHQVWP